MADIAGDESFESDIQTLLQLDRSSVDTLTLSSTSVEFVSLDFVKSELLSDSPDIPGIASRTDLIPGVYEGGFKVWESTVDLIDFIEKTPEIVKNKNVLDMGCGGGLVGIICLIAGATTVTFQDFNRDVLRYFTLSNIYVNQEKVEQQASTSNDRFQKLVTERCRFLSGDWGVLAESVSLSKKFDVIFTAETIYNECNYAKIVALIKKTLVSGNGRAFVAGKTYYFGVGGGMRSFENFLEEEGTFEYDDSTVIEASVQREILEIKHKQ